MFSNNEIFYPRHIYLDLDFNKIKNNLKDICYKYEDLGSVFVIKSDNFYLSVNNIGKVEVFFNELKKDQLFESISKVEAVFKSHVDDFIIVH